MFILAAKIATIAIAVLISAGDALAHEIPWPRGMSRQIGFGSCAKGPCMKRTSFDASVPHKHVAGGECFGMDAAGYTMGRRFACPAIGQARAEKMSGDL